MKRRVTIKDVAKEAGVSIAAVSMVMHAHFDKDGNPDCKIGKDTACKIMEAVEKLHYIPNGAAAQISRGRSGNIGVITSDISSNFFSEICRHIENKAFAAGCNAIFASTDETPERLEKVIYSMIKLGVDGLIIVPPSTDASALKILNGLDIPVVFLERDIPSYEGAGRLLLDNAEACRLAVGELYDSGYRHIENLSYDMETSTLLEKENGYYHEMEIRGLAGLAKVRKVRHGIDVDGLASVLKEAKAEGVEALFVPTNRLTISTLTAASMLGLRIPEDLAIVGFDRHKFFDLFKPFISHIFQSTEELGGRSFDMLMDMIENGTPGRFELLRPELVRGGSSAPSGSGK